MDLGNLLWRLAERDNLSRGLEVTTARSGPATGTGPTAKARWTGRMNAVVVSRGHKHYGDRLMGLAEIFFSPSANRMRVAIHRIRSLNHDLVAHTDRGVSFRNIAVTPERRFVKTREGSRFIDGAFYGPNHKDVAFSFRIDGVLGAGGGAWVTDAPPPEWAEAERFELSVRAAIRTSAGSGHAANKQLLCPNCNRRRGAKPFEAFVHERRQDGIPKITDYEPDDNS